MKSYHLLFVVSVTLMTKIFFSCQEKLLEELTIYSNDFESKDLEGIDSDEGFYTYNNNTVLGIFNNQGFTLSIDNLPSHNMIRISLDLYIHNYWNGNTQGVEGPDIWNMVVDNNKIIHTSFANTFCGTTYCQYQSYPENMFRSFMPKSEANNTNLPGLFEQQNNLGWTTLYRITKIITHNQSTVTLRCYDQLRQENVTNPKEDESWSIGKIEVSVLNVK